MSKGTDRRTVRIAPEVWEAARAVAHERGEPISDAIRRGLLTYINEQPAITEAHVDYAPANEHFESLVHEIARSNVEDHVVYPEFQDD